MKQELISALFGIITHYSAQIHQSENVNSHAGALTMHYAKDVKFRRAVNNLLDKAEAFINRQPESSQAAE